MFQCKISLLTCPKNVTVSNELAYYSLLFMFKQLQTSKKECTEGKLESGIGDISHNFFIIKY